LFDLARGLLEVGCLSTAFQTFKFNGFLIMQISNIVSGMADATTLGKKSESTAAAALGAVKTADSQTLSSISTSKASAEILKQYDVTNITPNQFTQMIQKLYKAGTISEKDYQDLSSIRTELENDGVEGDESVNLVELYSNKVSKLQKEMENSQKSSAAQENLSAGMQKLDWLQKFAVIQANPESAGLDVAA
jgi:hypothetical protein